MVEQSTVRREGAEVRRRVEARWLAAFLVPVGAAAAAVATWFRPGRFWAGGDITPFVRDGLAGELFSLWNHRVSGVGSVSGDVVRWADVAAIELVGWFGGPEWLAQQFFYTAVLALAALGSASLARVFTDRAILVAAAGVVGWCNPFVLVTLPNYLGAATIGVVGLLAALVLRAGRGDPVRPGRFALLSVAVSIVAVNPPSLVVSALAVLATALGASLLVGTGGTRRAVAFLMRAAPSTVLVNLWWLVPVGVLTLVGDGLELSAQTSATAWSWAHVNNGIADVVALNASWTWTRPEWLPFTTTLRSQPWALLRFALPLAALGAPFVVSGRRRRAAVALAAAAVVVAFFAKGLHEPLMDVNRVLYENVPGLWLLREPTTKLGGLLLLLWVVLGVLAATSALDRARSQWARRAVAAVITGVVAATVAFSFPLWTGAVVPGARAELPDARVAVPDEWTAAAAFVDEADTPGRALLLPLAPYYQVTTNWGYHGSDEVMRYLLRRPLLTTLPDGYFRTAGSVDALLAELEERLLAGDDAAAAHVLDSLGVSHVLLRRDLAESQIVRDSADADSLAAGLARVSELSPPVSFGVVDVYEADTGASIVRATGPPNGIGPVAEAAIASAVAEGESPTVVGSAAPVHRFRWTVADDTASTVAWLARGDEYRVARAGETAAYRARLVQEPDGATGAELYDPVTVTVGGAAIPSRPPVRVSLGDQGADVIGVGSTVLDLRGGSEVALSTAATATAYQTVGRSELDPARPVENCHAVDGRSAEALGLSARPISGGVRLEAGSQGRACVSIPLPEPTPGERLRLLGDVQGHRGAPPAMCVWLSLEQRCRVLPPLPPRGAFDMILPAAPGSRLHLYADAAPSGSAVEYRDLRAEQLRPVGSVILDAPAAPAQLVELGPGEHEVTMTRPEPASTLGSFSAAGDCARVDKRELSDVGIEADVGGETVRLRARDHVACVRASIDRTPGDRYRLELDARTIRGNDARICVWQHGPDACAEVPPLERHSSWARYEAEFSAAPDTESLELYLYADGVPSGTEVEFGDLAVRPVHPVTVDVRPLSEPGPELDVSWHESRPGRFEATIPDVDAPFLLTVAEAYAPGWTVRGLPDGATAEHVVVDGYANGWWIEGATGDLDLTVEYAPARWAQGALAVSAVTMLALLVMVPVRRLRARRTR